MNVLPKSKESNYFFFDTETTGKPRDYRAPMTDLGNWPRVIQLAWAVYSPEGEELASRCDLIKPDGWVIPVEKFWIDNGYKTEINQREGIPMYYALGDMMQAMASCSTMVAHNIQFDHNVLGAEMIRYNMRPGNKLERFCTMEAGTDICRIPGGRMSFKWPTLTELHSKLFNCGFDGAHDALFDVKACAKCFFGMRKLDKK